MLVAGGRVPNTTGMGLERIGLYSGAGGFIGVNDKMQTTVRGVYAIGDIMPGPMLAHPTLTEGIVEASDAVESKAIDIFNPVLRD